MTLNTSERNSRPASGFSLLELLVTLVVLSIGLLGLGLMQTTGLGLTKAAYSRTQAMMLASDIADRIRANENSAASYVGTAAGGTPGCIAGAVCATGAEIAASDMADWANRVALELPGGVGKIYDVAATTAPCPGYSATSVLAGFMRVHITWNEVNNGTAAQNLTGGESGGDCYEFDFVF
jgi:type IV pilus assembly protein PilV